MAYPETAYYYYHWFVEHSDEIWLYFLKEFPGIAIQDMVCWAKEHAKNLSKQEFAPLAPQLHNGHLKKTFYRIMRNWNTRTLHFIDTIPIKRSTHCKRCGLFCQIQSSHYCPVLT